jgi:hypothetical protein
MKLIQHSVFAERERAEAFINEIGVESVVSINEHASILGPFSVVVWWYRELPDKQKMPHTETLVIRPADESKTA